MRLTGAEGDFGFKARLEMGLGQRVCEGDDTTATCLGEMPGIKKRGFGY